MKKGLFTILLFLPALLLAQADSLKGDIKSIREKLIFLDSTKQNMKLFSSEGDYGHYGFSSPEFTFSRFNSWWFNTPWVHYLNYFLPRSVSPPLAGDAAVAPANYTKKS